MSLANPNRNPGGMFRSARFQAQRKWHFDAHPGCRTVLTEGRDRVRLTTDVREVNCNNCAAMLYKSHGIIPHADPPIHTHIEVFGNMHPCGTVRDRRRRYRELPVHLSPFPSQVNCTQCKAWLRKNPHAHNKATVMEQGANMTLQIWGPFPVYRVVPETNCLEHLIPAVDEAMRHGPIDWVTLKARREEVWSWDFLSERIRGIAA